MNLACFACMYMFFNLMGGTMLTQVSQYKRVYSLHSCKGVS